MPAQRGPKLDKRGKRKGRVGARENSCFANVHRNSDSDPKLRESF